MSVDQLIQEILQLPASERAVIAEQALNSLDKPDEKTDMIWREEAENRSAAVKQGKLKTVPLSEVLKKLGT